MPQRFRYCYALHFSSLLLGSLTLDLNRLTRGAKSSNKCTLKLAEDENNSEDIPMISLFKQRRIKGWWPFTAKNDQDQLEITVRPLMVIF